jgi:dephospho-CoA kinase
MFLHPVPEKEVNKEGMRIQKKSHTIKGVKMKKIILISGCARAGKDTFADAFCAAVVFAGFTARKVSLAEPIKALIAEIENETGVFIGKNRRLLQWIGTEWGRSIDSDLWLKALKNKITKLQEDYIVVPDVRFPNEAKFGKEKGIERVFIKADLLVRLERGAENNRLGHVSEEMATNMNGSDSWPGWVYFENNGDINGFCEQAELYATMIIGKE